MDHLRDRDCTGLVELIENDLIENEPIANSRETP